MGKVQRFEDLEIWQTALSISVKVYKVSLNDDLKKEWGIRDQVIRSTLSVSSNIAEGFEYNSDPMFCKFLKIAKRSAGELRSQLYFLQRAGLISQEKFDELHPQVVMNASQIKTLINYLKKENSQS